LYVSYWQTCQLSFTLTIRQQYSCVISNIFCFHQLSLTVSTTVYQLSTKYCKTSKQAFAYSQWPTNIDQGYNNLSKNRDLPLWLRALSYAYA